MHELNNTPAEPVTIELGHGLISVGKGYHGDARSPAILFGRAGAGIVGVETPGDRMMELGERIAAITFGNAESLDVVAEKLAELRALVWPEAPAPAYRKATAELTLPELAQEFAAVAKLGGDYTLSAGVCAMLHAAMTTPPAVSIDDAANTAALAAENDRLRAALGDEVAAATLLRELSLKDGGLNVTMEGGACAILANAFHDQFDDAGAENFVEVGFSGRNGRRILVTLQRVDGKTPAQFKTEAEAKVADYEEVLAGHRRLVRELDVALNGEAGAAKQASLVDIVKQVRGQGLHARTRADSRMLEIGQAIERACDELPEGFEVHIELERGAGIPALYDPEGERQTEFRGDTLADQINSAISYAVERAPEGGDA